MSDYGVQLRIEEVEAKVKVLGVNSLTWGECDLLLEGWASNVVKTLEEQAFIDEEEDTPF